MLTRQANRLISRYASPSGVVWPCTLTEAKAFAQVEHSNDDLVFLAADGLRGLIPAATAYVENRGGLALVQQTRKQTWDGSFAPVTNIGNQPQYSPMVGNQPQFSPSASELELGVGPLISVTSLKYLDTVYTEQTVPSTTYRAITERMPGRIKLKNTAVWPTTIDDSESVYCTYEAGYGASPAAVPPDLINCVLILVAYWYEHRDLGAAGKISADFAQAFDRQLEAAGAMCRYV